MLCGSFAVCVRSLLAVSRNANLVSLPSMLPWVVTAPGCHGLCTMILLRQGTMVSACRRWGGELCDASEGVLLAKSPENIFFSPDRIGEFSCGRFRWKMLPSSGVLLLFTGFSVASVPLLVRAR